MMDVLRGSLFQKSFSRNKIIPSLYFAFKPLWVNFFSIMYAFLLYQNPSFTILTSPHTSNDLSADIPHASHSSDAVLSNISSMAL